MGENARASAAIAGASRDSGFGGVPALLQAGSATARDVMTTKVISVEPHETVDEAARLMLLNRISGLAVQRGGRVVGVVSEVDLISRSGTRVEQVMTSPAITVKETTRLQEVAQQLTKIRRAPVVDEEGRLVGIVSRSDILRWAAPCECPDPCPRDHEHE